MLTPTLNSVSEVFHKLEREKHRTFVSMNPVHKADHLYNFCVTSNALKDCFFQERSITEKNDKHPFWRKWAQVPDLRAASEIANNVKHFSLERVPVTKKVEFGTRELMFTTADKHGVPQRRLVEDYPDIVITLSSGERRGLFEFTYEVVNYWKDFYLSEGFAMEEQDFDLLTAR